jgi:ATP-dependent helicase HrpB
MIDVTSLKLPITDVLPELLQGLHEQDTVILEAPPGAGKTTLAPLSVLLAEPDWLAGQKILVLEPRRIATRTAAQRMASLLKEQLGERVGYRMRLDTRVSNKTRIEVITEGILNRMIQSDPSLEGVGLIIFDEFHERHLDSDLGLALSQYCGDLFRDQHPLKIMVMSATLEHLALDKVIPEAITIKSLGQCFPVDIRYLHQKSSSRNIANRETNQVKERIQATVTQIEHALNHDSGSILVFLPGEAEIKRCRNALSAFLKQFNQDAKQKAKLTPLYGKLSIEEQALAIEPAPHGQRKIVLTTSIAETSLTIEGVRIVIDSGLSRLPEYDPRTAMTRLATKPVSKATATQRSGRAGRTEAGICYRLWSEQEHHLKQEHSAAEITQTELSGLAIQLFQLGISPKDLNWIDIPPQGHYQQALSLLIQCGALCAKQTRHHSQTRHENQTDQYHPGSGNNTPIDSEQLNLTDHGTLIAEFPVSPRIAHMLTTCAENLPQHLPTAAMLGVLLTERDPFDTLRNNTRKDPQTKHAQQPYTEADLGARILYLYSEEGQKAFPHYHQAAKRLIRSCTQIVRHKQKETKERTQAAEQYPSFDTRGLDYLSHLIVLSYPDRIAKKRTINDAQLQVDKTLYQLASGQIASLSKDDPLSGQTWLAIAVITGHSGGSKSTPSDHIRLAVALDAEILLAPEPLLKNTLITERKEVIEWDQSGKLKACEELRAGRNLLSERVLKTLPDGAKELAAIQWIRRNGIESLPWNKKSRQLQARIALLHKHDPSYWPDLCDKTLIDNMPTWLSPYLTQVTHYKHIATLDMHQLLLNQLQWPQPQELEALAPSRFIVPSGSSIAIDYQPGSPVLAVKLQEMFGCTQTPCIIQGKQALTLHLLSPANRPLQVTQDLISFWDNAYDDVKKENKGRYPKHPWPDNPMQAEPTRLSKAALAKKTRIKELKS